LHGGVLEDVDVEARGFWKILREPGDWFLEVEKKNDG